MGLDVPANALLCSFGAVADGPCSAHLALRHHAHGHADMVVQFELHREHNARPEATRMRGCEGEADDDALTVRTWHPGGDVHTAHATVAAQRTAVLDGPKIDASGPDETAPVRFPLFAPLLRAIEAQLASGLPVQWWLGGEGATAATGAMAVVDAAALGAAKEQLHARLQEQLSLHLASRHEASWRVFLWLLEEWCLAAELQRVAEASSATQATGASHSGEPSAEPEDGGASRVFRIELRAPEAVWANALTVHLPPTHGGPEEGHGGEAVARLPRWRVVLIMRASEPASEAAMCAACF